MNKNKQIKKRILMGTMITVLLGVLIFISPLQGTAITTQDQQPPIDVPQPGEPFVIPGNGSSVYLIPGEELILTTPSGVSINLTVDESVDISVIESTDLPAEAGALPEEAHGLGRYLAIELSDSAVDLEAIFSMSYDDGDLPPGVAADQLYFAFYNASTGEWQGVPSWVDTNLGMVHGITNEFSTWTVMSTPDGPPIDVPQPGEPFVIPGNGSSVYLIPGEELILTTPSGVSINLTVDESVDISVIESTDLPAEAGALPEEAHGLGRYLAIELSDSAVDLEAIISMSYDDSDLPPEVAADALFFAFYNASTGEWQGVPSWVDTNLGMVYGSMDHFSTWTVLGETETSESTETSEPTDQSTSSSTTSNQPSPWFEFNNVRDGLLISLTVLSLFLVVIAIVNRRQK